VRLKLAVGEVHANVDDWVLDVRVGWRSYFSIRTTNVLLRRYNRE
jgi:hypothetical protein